MEGEETGLHTGLREDHLYFISELSFSPLTLYAGSPFLSFSLSLSHTHTHSLTHHCSVSSSILNSSEDAEGTLQRTPSTSSLSLRNTALKAENWTSLLEPSFPASLCCGSHSFFTEAAPLSQGFRIFLNPLALPSPSLRIAGLG